MKTRIGGAIGIATLAFLAGFAAAPAGFNRDRAVVEMSHMSNVLRMLDYEQQAADELMLSASGGDDKEWSEDCRTTALAIQKTRTKVRGRMYNLCRQYGLEDE